MFKNIISLVALIKVKIIIRLYYVIVSAKHHIVKFAVLI